MIDLVDFAGVLTCTWPCAAYVTTPEATEAPTIAKPPNSCIRAVGLGKTVGLCRVDCCIIIVLKL